MKYITILDIAKELGISKSTVSRALSGDVHNVKPETMRLITETANRMGYQRNEMAVNLRKQNTKTIGVIIPETTTTFFMHFINHVQEALRHDGYRVLIAVSDENPDIERENIQMFEQCRVEGIMISVCHKDKNRDIYERVISHGTPIVFFDRTAEGVDASSVSMDDYIMAFFMVEALIRSGRRKIVHLAGPEYITNADKRLMGYRDALEKFHIEYDKDYVVGGGIDAEQGAGGISDFLAKGLPFDAVFGFTETPTLGAKTILQKLNYHIPEDVSLCCISGTTLCKLVHPTITAVEQPVREMAVMASRLMIRQIENPQEAKENIILRGGMIMRESTKTD